MQFRHDLEALQAEDDAVGDGERRDERRRGGLAKEALVDDDEDEDVARAAEDRQRQDRDRAHSLQKQHLQCRRTRLHRRRSDMTRNTSVVSMLFSLFTGYQSKWS